MSSSPKRHSSTLVNHPIVSGILPQFVSRLPAHVRNLRAHLAARDLEKLRLLAHQLRGAGKSYGFADITSLAEVVEEKILAGSPADDLVTDVHTLAEYLEHVDGYDARGEDASP